MWGCVLYQLKSFGIRGGATRDFDFDKRRVDPRLGAGEAPLTPLELGSRSPRKVADSGAASIEVEPAPDRDPGSALHGVSEILFLDSGVSDFSAVLQHLRPGVGAIVLDAERPAARQMATAVEGRAGLQAIHVIAHGAPGRVAFASGDWSSGTLADEASDLAMIGGSLDEDADLRLWSCRTGAGFEGSDFIVSLSRAAGRAVAAASHDVGAQALGGFWELNLRTEGAEAQPPLTEVGMGIYAGILIAEVMVTGTLPVGNMAGPVTHYIVDTDHKAIVGQVVLPNAMPKATPVSMAVKVPNAMASLAIGTFDAAGNFQRSSILSVHAPAKPAGAVGPSGR